MGMPSAAIRALIVDDSQMERRAIRAVLEADEGIEVVGEATDGAEAVVQAAALSPDIIIMDIKMPKMNGIEATCLIRSRCPDVCVILITALGSDGYKQIAASCGAKDFVAKEQMRGALVASVYRALVTG